MDTTKLRKAELRKHLTALRAPQPFPLTGDGRAMEHVWNRQSCMVLQDRAHLAEAIVEARYLDWQASQKKSRRGRVR